MKTAPTFPGVKVVGMHFREREGIPAKAIVANMMLGEQFLLEREPQNQFDPSAIKVLYDSPDEAPQHIGYIEAVQACNIAPWMDQGYVYLATVEAMLTVKNQLHPIVRCEPLSAAETSTETEVTEDVTNDELVNETA